MYNLLIIDDDEDDQYLLKFAFEEESTMYKFSFGSNGKEGLELIQKAAVTPDLILLDLNMPLMNGFEVLARIRASPPYCHIPVVILTTSANSDDIIKAYQLGANSFVTKPYNSQSFRKLAKSIQSYWFSVVERPRLYTTN